MRTIRLIVPIVAAITVGLAPAAAAARDPYPAPPPSLTVSAGVVIVGDDVEVFGNNFAPNATVRIRVSFETQAAGYGAARSTVIMPDGYAGAQLGRSGRRGLGTGATAGGHATRSAVGQTVATDAFGSFNTVITLDRVGTAVITAIGASISSVTIVESVTVQVWPLGRALPITGGTTGWQLPAGVGAVVVGAVMVWLGRSRRRRFATAGSGLEPGHRT